MKTKSPSRRELSPEELIVDIMSTTDQDNFEETMPTYLLEEWIRDQGGDPEKLWAAVEPVIKGVLAARAKGGVAT